jgi:hypothetical protein
VNQARYEEFCTIYRRELHKATAEHPEEYVWSKGVSVDTVADRMSKAFADGTFNHDGRAIKATCKALGIPHTRKAIKAFMEVK